ncbi:uncharacterized protein PAC_14315 [Phialocephala subalpina]|uniref:DUF7730 domain-containing protein n=1 Tax=Phialocephala subalpina TaxID=576137 RepID=A0A1L7XHJ3_9HELO|nr:uncharacterized protein PAC_14315 [Phialocephala subalpina]
MSSTATANCRKHTTHPSSNKDIEYEHLIILQSQAELTLPAEPRRTTKPPSNAGIDQSPSILGTTPRHNVQLNHSTRIPPRQRKPKNPVLSVAKDGKTKELIFERNATTSRLLKLLPELRLRIWEYVLGHRLVHVASEQRATNSWWFHTICESTTTERETYELSKSEGYDKSAIEMKEGEDIRFCSNRHAACYKALGDADRHNHPPNKLDIDILGVCPQAYDEASAILYDIARFSSWKELYVDVTVNRAKDYTHMKQYFPADRIRAICFGNDDYNAWQGRASMAETLRSHLAVLGQQARDRKGKSEAKAMERQAKKDALRDAEAGNDPATDVQPDDG